MDATSIQIGNDFLNMLTINKLYTYILSFNDLALSLLVDNSVELNTENNKQTKRKINMKNLIKKLTVAAVVVGCGGSAFAIPSGPAIQLISGASDIVVQDNGVGDGSLALGSIVWSGSVDGWNLVITSALTKPAQGSATAPNMDLTVQSSGAGGASPLTVEFTDTGFGPLSGGLVNLTSGNNGTSVATYASYYDTGNNQFALTTPVPGGVLNLTSYSLTLVDTFTVGTISSDHRLTGVPDGGSTVMLLGAALSAMGLLRRKLIA